jgi:hypothetical protein
VTGRLFIASRGELRPVDPESSFRPQVDCARCVAPVERMALLRDSEGGWHIAVRCHERIVHDKVLWGDLLGGDVVVGPAFDPHAMLVRRAP